MGGSLFGLGAGTPTRFPYADRPQPAPGIGPSQGQVIRARFVIVAGRNGGVFVYNGVPGPGNPPADWISENTVDPFGNALPHTGVGSEGLTGNWIAMSAGQLLMALGGSAGTQASLLLTAARTLQLAAQTAAVGDVQAALTLTSAVAGAVPTSVLNAALTATAGTASTPTLVTTDTWHTVQLAAFGAGFQAGNPAPQYALEPTGIGGAGMLRLRGQVLATGATAANATMFTVPYTFPALDQSYVTATNAAGYTAGARVVKAANGTSNVELAVTAANTNFILVDGVVIPLA